MKSLEIANKEIERLNKKIAKLKEELISGGAKFEKVFLFEIQQWETIKQDLEVLEIIYKKKVELELLEYLLVYKTNEKILDAYNSNPARIQLTLEELTKIIQWLEENE